MFYVLQEDNHDCGFTCLKALLASVNADTNYLYLPNPKGEGEVYSFHELSEYASSLGFTLSGYLVADKENLQLVDDLPILISIYEESKTHMIMIYRVKKGTIYYLDPAVGKKKMKLVDLVDKWDGKMLKLDDFKKQKCAQKYQGLLTRKEELIMDFFEIISGMSIVLGLLFTREQYPFYLPIILFAAFAIFEILLRSYCLHVFKAIDERTYNDSLKVKKGKLRDFYYTLEQNKQYEVSINLNSIYAVMSIVVIALFLSVTGGFSLYYLFFGLIFAFIEVMFIQPYLDKKNQEILEIEHNIQDDDLSLIKLAHQKAYQYGRISLLYRYTILGLTLLGIVTIMAISGAISIPYIIFYLCVNVFFYKNLVMGLGVDRNIRKHRQNIAHQINLIDN